MHLRKRQLGLGLWGWMYVLGTGGFVVMCGMQLTPIYLSEMAIQKVVKATAQDSGNAGVPIQELRKNMQTRWDVEGITTLDVKDVQYVKSPCCFLAYAYDAKAPLFYNLSLTAHFENRYPIKGGGGAD